MSDESRKAILARRATFVAAALAGIACGKTTATDSPPTVCLSVPIMPVDAAGTTLETEDAGVTTRQAVVEDASAPTPAPCLSVRPPGEESGKKPPKKPKPSPRPCLLMAPMIDDHDGEK